ncbi:MAG: TolC family protein [Bacteroidales bacterium]
MEFRKSIKKMVTLFMLLFLSVGLHAQTAIATSQVAEEQLNLTLESAVELALDQNLTVKIADQEIKRVDWLTKENWYALLPGVSASGQYTNNVLKPVFFSDFFPGGKMEVGSTHSYAVTGALQVPIISMPLFKNIELSEIELKGALESLRNTKIELLAQVKNSFYGILMMEESLKVLQESYNNAKETANNIKKMYENGLASEYDMIRSDVSVRNITPSIAQAKSGLELANMQLKVLLSLDLNTPIKLEGDINSYKEQMVASTPTLHPLLEGNSNLRTLDIQLESLNKTFELIRSQRLPSLAGFANYQLQMQSNEFTFSEAWTNSFAVGLSLQIPIFNKLSITLKEKQTKVGIQQLQYQRELMENNLAISVRNSQNEMNRAKVQLESDMEAVKQATKGYHIAKVRYNTGAGTLLELNDTEMALTNSKLNLNQTIYDYIKAKTEYDKVLGKESLIN